jgi:hypothetical protein
VVALNDGGGLWGVLWVKNEEKIADCTLLWVYMYSFKKAHTNIQSSHDPSILIIKIKIKIKIIIRTRLK